MVDRQDKKVAKELVYETEEGLNVPVMFESLFIKQMGRTLDLLRISDISERNLTQLSRTIKDDCYHQIELAKAILKKHGVDDISSDK